MGFFGKLFEKKECSVCGGEIGLLGNRKLEDGNLCKNCAAKLSPWFSDRRSSTVAQIEEQLAYREANRAKVAAFHPTRTLGEDTKLILDEDQNLFVVTDARNLAEDNPDVIPCSDVTGCELDIDESRSEIMREDKDGKRVSYNPPRYEYRYNFYIDITVNHPYFDNIRFRINDSTVEMTSGAGRPMGGPRPGGPTGRPGGPMGRGGMGRFSPENDPEYRRYKQMGEEIRQVLMDERKQAREEASAAAAPKAAVTCPYCGATTTPDASGCCEYCGGAVNG